MVRIPAWHEAAASDDGQPSRREVRYRRRRGHAVVGDDRDLGGERSIVEPSQEHIDRALGSGPRADNRSTDSTWQVSFLFGTSEVLLASKLRCQTSEALDDPCQICRRASGRDTHQVASICREARVFRIHRADGRNTLFPGQETHLTTGYPVASGVESRTGDYHVRTEAVECFSDRGAGKVAILRHVVISADDRCHDPPVRAQLLLKQPTRPDRTVVRLNREPCGLFPTDAAEELVEV